MLNQCEEHHWQSFVASGTDTFHCCDDVVGLPSSCFVLFYFSSVKKLHLNLSSFFFFCHSFGYICASVHSVMLFAIFLFSLPHPLCKILQVSKFFLKKNFCNLVINDVNKNCNVLIYDVHEV